MEERAVNRHQKRLEEGQHPKFLRTNRGKDFNGLIFCSVFIYNGIFTLPVIVESLRDRYIVHVCASDRVMMALGGSFCSVVSLR